MVETVNYSVKKIPWPFLQPPGFTAFGKIYLRDSLWFDFLSDNPKPETLAIIAHERTHIARLGSDIKTYLKYWTDSDFRFNEELVAITEEVAVLKSLGEMFDVNSRAKDLAGFSYLWCTNFDTAKKRLDEIAG